MKTRIAPTPKPQSPILRIPAWEDIQESVEAATVDKVPEGFCRAEDLERFWKKERTTVLRTVRILIAEGKAEMKKFRVRAGSLVKAVPHYRFL